MKPNSSGLTSWLNLMRISDLSFRAVLMKTNFSDLKHLKAGDSTTDLLEKQNMTTWQFFVTFLGW